MQALIANLNKLKILKEIDMKSNFKSLFKPKKNSVCEKNIKSIFENCQKKLNESNEGINKVSEHEEKSEEKNELTIIEEEKNMDNDIYKFSQNKILQLNINPTYKKEIDEKEEDHNKIKRPLLKRTLSEPELMKVFNS